MDVMREADELERAGADIIHLEVGQPGTGMPKPAVDKTVEKLNSSVPGYTVASGISALKARISQHYGMAYNVELPPDSIFITTGSSAGFQLSFLAAFEPGDRVALASPGYPAYRHILTSLSLEPVLIPVSDETRFQLSVEALANCGVAIDGVILASPSNPTGTMVDHEGFHAILEYCQSKEIRLISDEIYHGITFGARAETAAIDSNAIVVNSFSKYFCMTGWRVGWLIVPKDLRRSIECLVQNHYISPPTISQWAAVEVFDHLPLLDAHVARYASNREILTSCLSEINFGVAAPSDGAFYLYYDVSRHTTDSVEFCKALLHEANVAMTPGIDFDATNGNHFVRISFAGATEDMKAAVTRITNWMQ